MLLLLLAFCVLYFLRIFPQNHCSLRFEIPRWYTHSCIFSLPFFVIMFEFQIFLSQTLPYHVKADAFKISHLDKSNRPPTFCNF